MIPLLDGEALKAGRKYYPEMPEPIDITAEWRQCSHNPNKEALFRIIDGEWTETSRVRFKK